MKQLPKTNYGHDWVRYTVEDMAVIVDPETGHASAEPGIGDRSIGEQVACRDCGEPLTDSSVLVTCEGDPSMKP